VVDKKKRRLGAPLKKLFYNAHLIQQVACTAQFIHDK
jgi:hypothetical protein